MVVESMQNPDLVGEIAASLVEKFLQQVYDSCNERNYYVYIGSLLEIIDWSHEFYDEYCDKLDNWEEFEKSEENIFNAINREDFLIAWGYRRIGQFLRQDISEKSRSSDGAGEFNKQGSLIG